MENETDCFEVEPIYELRVGHGVQLISMVRCPNEQTMWFAQVPYTSYLLTHVGYSYTLQTGPNLSAIRSRFVKMRGPSRKSSDINASIAIFQYLIQNM